MKNSFLVLSFRLYAFFSLIILSQPTNKINNSDTFSSAFNPVEFQWDIAWPGRIFQYDLLYKSSPIDPIQGIPFGNGDVAALFWCEDST